MILVDSLGDDFPTFPQFQRALRAYEAELLRPRRTVPPPVFRSRPPAPRYGEMFGVRALQTRLMTNMSCGVAPDRHVTCTECGHGFMLAANATDCWCARCGPRMRRRG